jgi:hypothetical protein
MTEYYCGVSLTAAPDVCTFVAVKMTELRPALPRYAVQVAHVWAPDTTLPTLIRGLESHLFRDPLRGRSQLIVEAPAACRPWIDQLRSQAALQLVAVQLQERGAAPSHVGANWMVSADELAGGQDLLLQMDRLELAGELPHLAQLVEEMQAFRRIWDGTAPPRRLGLCLALAVACWWAEREVGSRPPPLDLGRGMQGLHKAGGWHTPASAPRVFRSDAPDEDYL